MVLDLKSLVTNLAQEGYDRSSLAVFLFKKAKIWVYQIKSMF